MSISESIKEARILTAPVYKNAALLITSKVTATQVATHVAKVTKR
jgi:hypothetical protein